MALELHAHPLSSYCHKVLVALYENATPFEFKMLNLGDPAAAAAFKALWPIAKMPVLRDTARDWMVPEASIIIEYLDQHYPGPAPLIPRDPDAARQMRLRDRFFDLYVMTPMQKLVSDILRPDGAKDPHGVAEARATLVTAYDLVEQAIGEGWVMGEAFTMADCAAAPALFYADMRAPLATSHPRTAAYLERLKARPSYARALAEAEPYFSMIPT